MPKLHLTVSVFLSCLIYGIVAAPIHDEAQIFFDSGEQSIIQPFHSSTADPALNYNLTFDTIDLRNHSQKPLSYLYPLKFTNFDILNVTAASHENLIYPFDTNCAIVGSNALFTHQTEHFSPSRFDFDPEIPRRHNVSDYVDFVGFTVKQVGMIFERGVAEIQAYRVHKGEILHVYSGGAVWPAGGFETPIRADLGVFFKGWGKDVNMFEVTGRTVKGEPVQLCVGRIEVFLKR